MLEGPEESMSLKDLLVSARHQSRNPSDGDISHSQSNDITKSKSPEPVVQHDSHHHGVTTPNGRKLAVNTSDGDSSANPEEMPTTPSGSNHSSLVSQDADIPLAVAVTGKSSTPLGLRIVNESPSVVALSSMKPYLPRLQVATDDTGRTMLGEGVQQIANLARSFGQHDREIIGATVKYIVYALKGISE
jgi:hypothetical protein